MSHWVIFTDGASRGNPGPAAAGWVLCDVKYDVVASGNQYLGRQTNNEAEYAAAILAIKAALKLGATSVELRADSQLMIRQLTGAYRVNHPNILPLFRDLKASIANLQHFAAVHVPRAQNALADAQANLAIDTHQRSLCAHAP